MQELAAAAALQVGRERAAESSQRSLDAKVATLTAANEALAGRLARARDESSAATAHVLALEARAARSETKVLLCPCLKGGCALLRWCTVANAWCAVA